MRLPRIKPTDCDTWHHCYNRIAGVPNELPFGPTEKEEFVRLLHRLAKLYCIRIAAYQVMSNHFHLLLFAPAQHPSLQDTASRFHAFHNGRRSLDPSSPLCAQWQARLRDVSWFMAHLQRLFTVWYNRSRMTPRRGALWAGRFKNTVLEAGAAVWNCWRYIEMNPVRAGLVSTPADYRFSSFGHWSQTGRHPFELHLDGIANSAAHHSSATDAIETLYHELHRLSTDHKEDPPAESESPLAFLVHLRRRVRYWVDGVAIGSELFVRSVMARLATPSRPLIPAQGSTGNGLFAWQHIRATAR